MIEKMATNSRFRELLDSTFEGEENCSNLIKYFNQKLGSDLSFEYFSSILDSTYEKLVCSDVSFKIGLHQLMMIVDMFLAKAKKRS